MLASTFDLEPFAIGLAAGCGDGDGVLASEVAAGDRISGALDLAGRTADHQLAAAVASAGALLLWLYTFSISPYFLWAALCAAALLRRLYRDERSLFDGAEGDQHSYTDIKEAVDDALAREGPIGRTIALRCIRGCRASTPSQETWLSLLGASDQRVRVAAAEVLSSLNEPWCTPSLLCDGLVPQDEPNGAHGRLLCCSLLPKTSSTDDVKSLIRCASRLAPKNSDEVWCPPVHLVACEALARHAPATPRLAAAENACVERILGRGTRPDTLPGEGRLDAALCVRRCARLIGEDANEALKLLDEDVADPVAIGLLGAAAKACGIVRDERFRDDLDLDEATCEIGEGRVPPYVVQAELRRLVTASPSRRAAALKLALAAAACGSRGARRSRTRTAHTSGASRTCCVGSPRRWTCPGASRSSSRLTASTAVCWRR